MTKVKINPGICGLVTSVEASSEDGMEVALKIRSGCEAVRQMVETLGDTFDSFDICLAKPGDNLFYKYAAKNFPGHAACPVIAGLVKAVEVECHLALPKNAEILFES